MSYAQSMTRSIAASVIEVVAADAECRKFIPVVSGWSVAQRGAGGFRNLVNMTGEGIADTAMDITRFFRMTPERTKAWRDEWTKVGEDQACTNIADVTKRAILAGIKRGTLSHWIADSWRLDREPSPTDASNHVIAYHSATAVQTHDKKTYVFDWHATLMLRNPLISRSADEWLKGNDHFRSAYSTFQGWG
ncbi:hypothetical protein [Roseococcus sp. YIM B11640]|uniref:hypothetical protein n=1 Tax=Roseococcus sp. YIM B11640 TaxID=3133973 RepID=UPI003C798300